jgi:hypothetical protein
MSIFDFGRTDESNGGLRRHKRGWGAVEQPINYPVFSHKPVQPYESKILDLVQPVIYKAPLWMSRITGELR